MRYILIYVFVKRQILNSHQIINIQSFMIINRLSQATAEELCAQQVITSLPDCIKELVDNSIDASSTYIKIILHEYGKKKIEVIDNGLGISDFDFLGKKGSTSKNKGNDQFNYLGFRGEAVHSIGRVSAGMTIESKSSVDGYRRIFKVHTTQLQVFKQQRLCHGQFNFQVTNLQNSRNTGTKVTIDDIFSKLPVRRIQLHAKFKQFLKKTNQLIKEYCLIYPEIQFIFINTRQNKPEIIIETTCLKIFNRSNWLERIKQLDDRIGNSLIYINGQFFEGFVLNKIQSGSSRENNFIKKHYHYLYLNKRPIDIINVLLATLNQIYKKYNNNTKYAFIINLKLKHEMMDVNLTPNKREVFIRKQILEKIVKELKEKIVQKVIQDIPTLSSFEDKRKTTQSQQRFSASQPSITDHFTQKQVEPAQMRKPVSFASQYQPNPSNNNQQIPRQSQNSKPDGKYSSLRDINGIRNSFNQNLNQKIQESKNQLVINKSNKLSFDLPQLPKVNVNINKIKQNLNSIFSVNRDSIKRISVSSEDIKITLPHVQNIEPVNKNDLQQIRKENKEKKIRQEQEDAKKRSQFLKEVKIQYNDEQNQKKSKLNIEKYRQSGASSRTRENKAKQNLMQQDVRRRQFDVESYYEQPASHKQSYNDEVQEIPSSSIKNIQPYDKSLENRIKTKINIDMSQIFTNFNKNKNLSNEKIQQNINNIQRDQNQEQSCCAHNQINLQNHQQIDDQLNQEALMIDGKGNAAKKSIRKENFRDFQIIGQFNMGFILCIYNRQYFLVDQHAASQKFHYQRFLKKSQRLQSIKSEQSQQISGIEADQIEDSKILLTEAGFFYKIMGRNRLQLERCPVFYETKLGIDYFWQIVEEKKQLHRIPKFTAMCAMKACKTAVVVGNALRYNQMKKIVYSLADLESPWNCPHGRPTLVQLGKRQVFRGKVILGKATKKYDL